MRALPVNHLGREIGKHSLAINVFPDHFSELNKQGEFKLGFAATLTPGMMTFSMSLKIFSQSSGSVGAASGRSCLM